MSDLGFLAGAFGVIWFASFAFIFSMVRRQSALQREIASLRELMQDRNHK